MRQDRQCVCCGESIGSRAINALYCWPCTKLVQKAGGRAGRIVKEAVANGALKPSSQLLCVDCGHQAEFYDHRDLTKPLEVEPVCNGCNVRRGPPTGIDKVDLEKYLAGLPVIRKGRPKKAIKAPPKKPLTIEQLGIKRRFFNTSPRGFQRSANLRTVSRAKNAYRKAMGLTSRDQKDWATPSAPVRRSTDRTKC